VWQPAATEPWDGVDSDGFLGGMTGRGDKYWMLNRLTRGGYAVSLGVKPACSALDVQFGYSVIMTQLDVFCLPSIRTKFKIQDGLQWFPSGKSCCTVAQACLRGCKCIFCSECGGHQTGVLGISTWRKVFLTSS